MDVKTNIAENIIALRKKNKWTQAELAEKLNYSDKAVSKWERGEAVPEIDTLVEMASLFGVTLDYFVSGDRQEQKQYVVPKVHHLYRKLAVVFLFSLAAILIALIVYMIGYHQHWDNIDQLWTAFVWTTPVIAAITFLFFAIHKIWLGSLISCCLIVVCLIASIFIELLVHDINLWMLWLVAAIIVGAIVLIFFMKK